MSCALSRRTYLLHHIVLIGRARIRSLQEAEELIRLNPAAAILVDRTEDRPQLAVRHFGRSQPHIPAKRMRSRSVKYGAILAQHDP